MRSGWKVNADVIYAADTFLFNTVLDQQLDELRIWRGLSMEKLTLLVQIDVSMFDSL